MAALLAGLRHRQPALYQRFRGLAYSALGLYGATAARLYGWVGWPAYRRANTVRRLQLGCATRLKPGWFNTDKYPLRFNVAYCDAAARYPFEDNAFDYIFTEHMIEHLPYAGGRALAAECLRVLKPGGKIRISTPDLDRILALRQPANDLERRYVAFMLDGIPEARDGHSGFLINEFVRAWGHTFIYDRQTLPGLLKVAGFIDIVEHRPGQSDDPNLAGLERHGEAFPDPDYNLIESMVFEATKPAR